MLLIAALIVEVTDRYRSRLRTAKAIHMRVWENLETQIRESEGRLTPEGTRYLNCTRDIANKVQELHHEYQRFLRLKRIEVQGLGYSWPTRDQLCANKYWSPSDSSSTDTSSQRQLSLHLTGTSMTTSASRTSAS